jgi:SAM-dependent methyltransferase
MMGSYEPFTYHRCVECGHTHLYPIPDNLSRYYTSNEYYSFRNDAGFASLISRGRSFLEKLLVNFNVKNSFVFSRPLKALLSIKTIEKESTILDYGSGAGQFVMELSALGFKNVKGYDPYLQQDIILNGETIVTNNLESLHIDSWSIIILNHVFEHLDHPLVVLTELSRMMCKNGFLVLRFPVIDSVAFEKYRENWVQFDAPRHLNLFTRKSIKLAVEQVGSFKIIEMYDDSYHFQFTGSELYKKRLSLTPSNNSLVKRLLSPKTYKYHFLAKQLNKQNKGDQLVVILQKI